jgi:hypothetical protein
VGKEKNGRVNGWKKDGKGKVKGEENGEREGNGYGWENGEREREGKGDG